MSDTTGIMFFCLGNICRSPLAEALFRHHVEARQLGHRFRIDSSGTSAYHVGEKPDPGSVRVARERLGLDITNQRSQKLTSEHLRIFDFLVAMDHSNLENARSLAGSTSGSLLLLRDFEPLPQHRGLAVPDPWGGGSSGFEEVFDIVDRCTASLLDHLLEQQ
jgi:protein-tyrosine phosphatase